MVIGGKALDSGPCDRPLLLTAEGWAPQPPASALPSPKRLHIWVFDNNLTNALCKWRSFKTIVHRNRSMLQALGFEGVGFGRQKRLVGPDLQQVGRRHLPGCPALGRAGMGFCQPPRRVSLFFPRRVRSLLEGSGKSTMHRWGGGGGAQHPAGSPPVREKPAGDPSVLRAEGVAASRPAGVPYMTVAHACARAE